jgi:RimJ/RimL family protein N-acetyltransferase
MTMPQPARGLPRCEAMEGRFARLEPLDEARHGASLWQAVNGADAIWTYLAYGPWRDEASFRAWLQERQALTDPLYFAVVEKASGKAQGCVTLMRFDQPNGVIETGHIFFAPSMQRTPTASEAIYLLARHVFDDLGYRRFEWKCDEGNRRSRHAALRFGFAFEGVFRQHMIVKGHNRDTAWFSMLDSEWPKRKAAFEAWLAPGNFDGSGYQRQSLSALNGVGVS